MLDKLRRLDCKFTYLQLFATFLQLFQSHQNHFMAIYIQNGVSFSKVREYEGVLPPIEQGAGQFHKLQQNASETRSDEKHDLVFQYFIKMDQKNSPKYDISFQKNFLVQHIKTLGAILQKTKESQPNTCPQKTSLQLPLSPPLPVTFPSINNLTSFLESLPDLSTLICRDQLSRDLRNQPDLEKFLNYTVENHQKQIVIPLIIITADILSEFRRIIFRDHEMKDLQTKAKLWTQFNLLKYFQCLEFFPLTGHLMSDEKKQKQERSQRSFQCFLLKYCTTILLIMGGFFQNPYMVSEAEEEWASQVSYPKRQLSVASLDVLSSFQFFSDSDQQLEPRKKIKKD